MKLDENNFIFTTRIDLPGEGFIVLREPTDDELKNFGEDNKKNMEILKKIMPGCIVEHNFDDATPQAIAAALSKSSSLYVDILTKWMQDIPFQKRIGGRCDK